MERRFTGKVAPLRAVTNRSQFFLSAPIGFYPDGLYEINRNLSDWDIDRI
jgi:hypothetical protein